MEPIELITAPFKVYVAAVGTSFPDIDADPSSWTLFGTSGERDIDESGVTVHHDQTINKIRSYGSTGPRKASRTEESLRITFNLMNMKPAWYDYALSKAGVTDTPAGASDAGHQAIGLYRGTSIYEIAMLIRGTNASPELEDTEAQYEIPRVIQIGSPAPAFVKGAPGMLAFEFEALEDENAATAADRFGHFRVKDAEATG